MTPSGVCPGEGCCGRCGHAPDERRNEGSWAPWEDVRCPLQVRRETETQKRDRGLRRGR